MENDEVLFAFAFEPTFIIEVEDLESNESDNTTEEEN